MALIPSSRIGANIPVVNADELARLAVQSAQDCTVEAGDDGINYLMRAKDHGIITALTHVAR